MQTVFIRHKFGNQLKILEYLWDNRLIAIHYDNLKSTNPEDFKGVGKQALKRLWRYCELGAIIGATYIDLHRDQMLIGKIEKGSTIELLDCSSISKDIKWLRVVSVKDSRFISFKDCPLLSAIQPKLVAITGWPAAEKCISAILGLIELEWDVASLAPSQLEVICYEFLRYKGILKALLLPIGRTMQDVDIFGIGENGDSVIAQVTQSTDKNAIQEKFDHLKKYEKQKAKLFFFGPKNRSIEDQIIQYIAIEDVFSVLSSDENAIYHQMISQMLQWQKQKN